MTTDLLRLLDLPAAAHLSIAGDELALLTVRHEHADKIIIERKHLGTSIDLGELLQIVGLHGLAETPKLHISEVAAPRLPAPVEETPEAEPVTCPHCQQTFKNERALNVHVGMRHKTVESVGPRPEIVACSVCGQRFRKQGLGPHMAKRHKAPAVAPVAELEPTPVLVAQSPAAPATPVPVSEYTCSACGVSLQLHERCGDCQALLGPEHEAGLAVEQGLCQVCVGYRATEHKLGLVAA
jgi:hypothetical protein